MSTVQPDYRLYNKSYTVINTQIVSGTWSSYATTLEYRYGHSSWVSPVGLLLMGGTYSPTTSEIVNGGMNFTLAQRT